jgi:hypothetical protein
MISNNAVNDVDKSVQDSIDAEAKLILQCYVKSKFDWLENLVRF